MTSDCSFSITEIGEETGSSQVRFILDKSFIKSWISALSEDNEDKYIKALMDLFYHLKTRCQINIVVPIDVLLEMKKDGVKEVEDISFKKTLNSLATIKEVNPDDADLTAKNSILKLAEKYKEQSIPCWILTKDESIYSDCNNGVRLMKASKIFFTIALMYDAMPFELKQTYNTWFKQRGISA